MLHKLSLLMTGLVMMMGAAWFALHTYGAPESDDPKPQDMDAGGESSEPVTKREETSGASGKDAGEDRQAALMIARATLNAQLIEDAAPVTAAVVEAVAAPSTSAPRGQPIVLTPAAPKPEPRKVAAKPVAEKSPPQPKAKPEASKLAAPKPAAKPKSIDDILDSLE